MNASRILYFSLAVFLLSMHEIHASNWTEARTLNGKITTLSQHFEEGKWTLVMLWTIDCGICNREYPIMSAFHDQHKDTDAKVLGVSLDGFSAVDKITRHIDNMPITFDNLIGEFTVIAYSYENSTEEPLRGTPTYMMFNPQGQLVGHNPGPVRIESLEKFMHRHN